MPGTTQQASVQQGGWTPFQNYLYGYQNSNQQTNVQMDQTAQKPGNIITPGDPVTYGTGWGSFTMPGPGTKTAPTIGDLPSAHSGWSGTNMQGALNPSQQAGHTAWSARSKYQGVSPYDQALAGLRGSSQTTNYVNPNTSTLAPTTPGSPTGSGSPGTPGQQVPTGKKDAFTTPFNSYLGYGS
jgi:hypothetical protein